MLIESRIENLTMTLHALEDKVRRDEREIRRLKDKVNELKGIVKKRDDAYDVPDGRIPY